MSQQDQKILDLQWVHTQDLATHHNKKICKICVNENWCELDIINDKPFLLVQLLFKYLLYLFDCTNTYINK